MKRILALALCVLLLPAALAETYVCNYYGLEESPGYDILIRDDGTPLTPTRTYGTIYEITPEDTPEEARLYSVTPLDVGIEYDPEIAEDMLYDVDFLRSALMDSAGRLLTDYAYSSLEYVNGYVIFTLPDEARSVGAMDAAGHVVLEPVYVALYATADGKWLALLRDDDAEGERYAIVRIDLDGSVHDLGLHTRCSYFNVNPEGICALWEMDEYGGEMIYADSEGTPLFGRSFQYAENFVGRYAVVEQNELSGLIDRSGAFVLPPEYSYISHEAGKPFIAKKDSYFAVYDSESLECLMEMDAGAGSEVDVTQISAELLGVTVGEDSWIYRVDGEMLLKEPEGGDIQMYGYPGTGVDRLIMEVGEWPNSTTHLIDLSGNAVGGDYRMISEGRWQDGHARLIAITFNVIPDGEGDYMVDWNSYRFGVIDENGEILVPLIYDELRVLDFDRYWAVMGNRCGMIDSTGKWYYTAAEYDMLMD